MASANQEEQPVLTTFALPNSSEASISYRKWLAHPSVMEVVKLRGEYLAFEPWDEWNTGKTTVTHPKCDTIILVVANLSGIQQFVVHEKLEALLRIVVRGNHIKLTDLSTRLQVIHTQDNLSAKRRDPERVRTPKRFHNMEVESPQEGAVSIMSKTAADWNRWQECKTAYLQLRELAHNARDMVYTDGSKRAPKAESQTQCHTTGTGIFREGTLGRIEVAEKIRPSRPGPLHTINRAELVAIWYSIMRWRDEEELIIATDSALSMQMINAALNRPETQECHVHRELLQEIARQLLYARNRPTVQDLPWSSHIPEYMATNKQTGLLKKQQKHGIETIQTGGPHRLMTLYGSRRL